MSDKHKNSNTGNSGNNGNKERHNNDRGKSGWINEGQKDYDKIRKGAEVVLRPTEPNNDGNSNNKDDK